MPHALLSSLNSRLAAWQEKRLMRFGAPREGASGTRIVVDGKSYINFVSNDYLGLSVDPRVIQAFKKGVDEYGVGSGAARTLSGYTRAHLELEEALADFTGRDRALLFSSGYMANCAVLSTLPESSDRVWMDKYAHASLIDGVQLGSAPFKRYPHVDVARLGELLKNHAARHHFIVTESIFSMEGDRAPLKELAQLAQQVQGCLMVDDAHGIGVFPLGLSQAEAPVYVGTFGKAIGTMGAFVAGDAALIEALKQFARPFLFTTMLPPAIAVATREALLCAQAADEKRAHLSELIRYFRAGAAECGIPLSAHETPIQPIVMNDVEKLEQKVQQLREKGLWVAAIKPPTVPPEGARLRITLTAKHSFADLRCLLSALSDHA